MSKLSDIREFLQSDPEVIIANTKNKNFISEVVGKREGNIIYSVDFHVAPKKGIYTAHGLGNFMDRLIPPGMSPDNKYKAWERYAKYGHDVASRFEELKLGHMSFSEEVGQLTATRDYKLNDGELSDIQEFITANVVSPEITSLIRFTSVYLYPNEGLARDISEDVTRTGPYITSWRELSKYEPDLKHMLFLSEGLTQKS